MFFNKITSTAIIALCSFASANAQSLQEMFINTPDSILPYVTHLDREALIKVYDTHKDTCSVMDVSFGARVSLTRVSADQIEVNTSKAMTFQYGMLPSGNDSILCLIRTYKAPEAESTVQLYTRKWQFLGELIFNNKAQFAKPDTMTIERFEEIKKMQEVPLVKAEFSKESAKTIILQYTMPMMSEDDKKAFSSIISQTKFNWDGLKYN